MKRLCFSIALACLLAGTLRASDDPFCGKWKLNMTKSQFTGELIKIEALGGEKYMWTVGNVSDTLTYDGTEQKPDQFGRTTSMAPDGPNSWKMVIKKDGRVISTMTHTISEDGKTQTIKGTDTKPDGTTSDFDVTWKKVSGGSGWAGTWEETDVKFTSPDVWEIAPYEGDGLTFNNPAYQHTLSMKFDGKEYEEKGPDVAPGSTSSGKRVDAQTLDVTSKVKGEVFSQTKCEVSHDGKTLTLTIHRTGQQKAQTIVYDKI